MYSHSKFPVAGLLGLAAALLAAGSASAADAYHRVEAGNTLFSIARSHGVTVDALRAANGIDENTIRVGQRLRLPGVQLADEHEGEGHEGKEGKEGDEHHSALPDHREVAWGYGPDDGPRNWARLSAGFSLCGVGKSQAPIDLLAGDALSVGLMRPVFAWGSAAGRVLADDRGLRMRPAPGAGLELDGRHFSLEEVRFLSPSEHSIGGARLAGEVQFVHSAADGTQAVVAVLLERLPDTAVGVTLPALPARGKTSRKLTEPFDLSALLPADRRAFRYEGSLSTPPCTEGVKWLVMRQPLGIDRESLAALRERAGSKQRPIQPRNGRALLVDSSL